MRLKVIFQKRKQKIEIKISQNLFEKNIKNKRNLRRIYIQTKSQSIKPSLKSIKKEIERVINDYRDNQWENKP